MLTAKDIMTAEVVTIKKDASINTLANLFIEHKVNGIPVLNDEGEAIGMVTEGDLIEQNKNLHIPTVIALFDAVIPLEGQKTFESEVKRLTASKVEDIYKNKVISVSPDESVQEIGTLMAEKDVHTIPVIDNGKLIGIIGKVDLIKAMI
jgi:CBS-domain-containing membrane protein